MVASRTMPRHEAVEHHLRSRIAGSTPGDPIESDAELCQLFQVSRMTVRQATQRLVAEGAIYRVSGIGSFVGYPEVHRQMGTLRSFSKEMQQRGRKVSSIVLEAILRPGSKEEAAALKLAPRSSVVSLRRIRLADSERLAIENAVLPQDFAWILDQDMARFSLHAELAARGKSPVHATGTQMAVMATPEDAALLDLPQPAAIFVERRLVTASDGAPLEFTETRYAGSRFVFHIELGDGTAD
jgi:GntR family transcriptional regulator